MNKAIGMLMIVLLTFMLPTGTEAQTQKKGKGFDYKQHDHNNQKAKRWAKRRMKASDGDQVNLKCSARQSRRYARKSKG